MKIAPIIIVFLVSEKTVQMHTLPRLIAAGVFVLIVVTMAVTTYIIIIRMRCV